MPHLWRAPRDENRAAPHFPSQLLTSQYPRPGSEVVRLIAPHLLTPGKHRFPERHRLPDRIYPHVDSLVSRRTRSTTRPSRRHRGRPLRRRLSAAPRLDSWIVLQEATGRLALTGDVTGHPILGTAEIVTSRLFGIDASAGWVRTFSRWSRLGPYRTEQRRIPRSDCCSWSWHGFPRSATSQEDRRQTELLHKARSESGKVYGYRKLHDHLIGQGESICPNRASRLHSLRGSRRRSATIAAPAAIAASHRSWSTIPSTGSSTSKR